MATYSEMKSLSSLNITTWLTLSRSKVGHCVGRYGDVRRVLGGGHAEVLGAMHHDVQQLGELASSPIASTTQFDRLRT